MFRNAAKILGKTAEADKTLADLDQRFATIREQNPGFADQTAAVVDPGQKTFYAFAKNDPRGRFLADLGFAEPTELNKVIGDQFGAEISPERIDLLDLDRLLLLADAETRTWLAGNKIYQAMAVVKEKRTLEIPYYETPFAGAAMAYNTPLSVPYALDNLVPQLAGA
jgi:iron complex transport system substrate-binding protein